MKYKKRKNEFLKTFESFIEKSKWDQYENLSKPREGEVDLATRNRILDVNNFNKWLANDFRRNGRDGAPELIGRKNILTKALLVYYFLDQGVECTDEEIIDFRNKIISTWDETY